MPKSKERTVELYKCLGHVSVNATISVCTVHWPAMSADLSPFKMIGW